MKKTDEKFILSNMGKMTVRQIARNLGINRSEVERFISKNSDHKKSVFGLQRLPVWVWLLSVTVIGLLLRSVYFITLNKTPFAQPLANTLDDGIYHSIAQIILNGDYKAGSDMSAYRVPAYPYFLALIYRYIGDSFYAVRLVQLALGVASSALVFILSLKVSGNRIIAFISGCCYATYITGIFFENILLGESVSVFLALLGMIFFVSGSNPVPRMLCWLLAGVFFGLAILFRPHFLPAMPVLAVVAFWRMIRSEKIKVITSVMLCGVLTAGVLLPILPITYRNYLLHQDKILLSAQGGINLYIGNHSGAEGDKAYAPELGSDIETQVKNAVRFAEENAGRKLKPSEVSDYWTQRTLNEIRSDFASFVSLMFTKFRYLLNRYEFPDVLDMGFVSRFIPLLNISAVQYGMILILAFIGLATAYFSGGSTKNWQVLALIAGYSAGLMIFFISSRYRYPLVAFLCIPAGYGGYTLINMWKMRSFALPVKQLSVIVAAVVICVLPVEKTNYAQSYNSLAVYMKKRDRFREAEEYYRKAIELQPAYPSPYYNMALLYRAQNRHQEAQNYMDQYQRVLSESGRY